MSGWERRFAIACLVVGVMLLFLAGSLFLVEQKFGPGTSYPLIAGIALLIAYAILDPTSVRDLVSTRRSRFGSLSILVTAVVLGLAVMANVLAARSTSSLDLTRFKVNTLAPQSQTVMGRLDSDLNITVWDNNQDSTLEELRHLLARYQGASQRVHYRVVDPNFDPAAARAQGVVALDTMVLQYHGKTQILNAGSQTEQDITSAVLKLESNRTPQVCWVVGDGERDLKNSDAIEGYSEAANQITRDNFALKDLLLSQTATPPSDCDVVALIGPTKPLPEASIKVLNDYLEKGGRLLIALDPWRDAALTARYNTILAPYGLSLSGGMVVPDAAHAIRNEPTAVAVLQYGRSPVAKDLANRVNIFPESTSIEEKTATGVTVTPVAQTSTEAFLVQEPRQPPLTRQTRDKAGQYTLMDTAERVPTGGKKSRLVVVGTSAFGENEVLQATAVNIQLLTGSLSYLTEQESLISIPPKGDRNPSLTLTQEQQNLIVFITMLLLPALIVAGGIAVWARRRRVA